MNGKANFWARAPSCQCATGDGKLVARIAKTKTKTKTKTDTKTKTCVGKTVKISWSGVGEKIWRPG